MKPIPHSNRGLSRGITLVELMIALVVSSIVLLGVATVYSSSKRAYNLQQEMARLQENARYSFDVITKAVRQAGFLGPSPVCQSFLRNDAATTLGIIDGVRGHEFKNTAPGDNYTITSLTNTGTATDWSDSLPNWLSGKVLAGNDVVITTKLADPACSGYVHDGCYVKPPSTGSGYTITATSAALVMCGDCPVGKGAIVAISDGSNCDIFQNSTNINSTTINRAPAIGLLNPGNITPSERDWSIKPTASGNGTGGGTNCPQGSNTKILTGTPTAYFVGPGASGEPTLFRARYTDPCNPDTTNASDPIFEEIAEGIENMQVLYGVDNDPSDVHHQPDRFVTAAVLSGDFSNVVAVRISFLVRTPQETGRPATAGTYKLLGVEDSTSVKITTQQDRRVRKVYTTTILMRNKAINRRGFDDEF